MIKLPTFKSLKELKVEVQYMLLIEKKFYDRNYDMDYIIISFKNFS